MILCANMTNLPGDLNRFEGREDFARFCRQHGLDGVELLPLGETPWAGCRPRR